MNITPTSRPTAKVFIHLVSPSLPLLKIASIVGTSPSGLQAYLEAHPTGTNQVFSPEGTTHVLLGIGKEPTAKSAAKALSTYIRKHKSTYERLCLYFAEHSLWEGLLDSEQHVYITALAKACKVATYDAGGLKSEAGSPDRKPLALEQVEFWINKDQEAAVNEALTKGIQIANTQTKLMEMVNLPGNYLTPQRLAEYAVESGAAHGFEVDVWDKNKLDEMGFGGLLGVNKGSERPPVFILMEYKHPDAPQTIALAGKGVTFDTGGISLKKATNMHYMKSDMGGAAAVLGAIEIAAKRQLPLHLVAAIPATDNLPDGKAIVPGDILTAYGGITIEIADTDAEGRLILADAVSYLSETYQPDVMIDFATLTGAAVYALGYHAGALFTHHDELADALYAAGQASGERVWRLPLWDDYAKAMNSDVADIKNYGGPAAGAITAAKFIEKFTRNHPCWAHLDIAGVAFGNTAYAKDKSATGFGVELMLSYFEESN